MSRVLPVWVAAAWTAVMLSAPGCAPTVGVRALTPPDSCSRLIVQEGVRSASPAAAAHAWLRPDSDADRRTLDGWCRGVGPAVVVAGPAVAGPGATGVPPVDRLAVVSWNTHVGQGNLPALVAELRAGVLTGGVAVDDFVLLLQEARRAGPLVPDAPVTGADAASRIAPRPPRAAGDIVALAERLALHLYYVPSMRNGRACAAGACEDRGAALLSTLPFTDRQAIELPYERQRRVALAAQVSGRTSTATTWALRLVNVHLENRAGARRLWLRSGAARTRQVKALTEVLAGDDALLVAGDLNTWLGPLDRAGALVVGALDTSPLRAVASDRAPRGLDRILARLPPAWRVSMGSSGRRFESDHPAVVVILEPD